MATSSEVGGSGGAPIAGSDGGTGSVAVARAAEPSIHSMHQHTCARLDDGTYCWGRNRDGVMGAADEIQSIPIRLELPEPLIGVQSGEDFSCGTDRASGVRCWGTNYAGQLGQGDTLSRATPTPISLPGPARQLAVGYWHSCAVLEAGELWCWGVNSEYQLGQGEAYYPGATLLSPVRVGDQADWVFVSCGQGHTCGIRGSERQLYCWGRNTEGQLGSAGVPEGASSSPVLAVDGTDFDMVSVGQGHTCGLKSDASLWCWGDNTWGQLGVEGDDISIPTLVLPRTDFVLAQVNTFQSCALTNQGKLWCWGFNEWGELALGDTTERRGPTPILPETTWTEITTGRQHHCAKALDGSVWCAGHSLFGEVGSGVVAPAITTFQKALLP